MKATKLWFSLILYIDLFLENHPTKLPHPPPRTPKRLKVLHKSNDKRETRVSNLVLPALWRVSWPTRGHSADGEAAQITLIEHQLFGSAETKAYGCGWLQSVHLLTQSEGERRVRWGRGGAPQKYDRHFRWWGQKMKGWVVGVCWVVLSLWTIMKRETMAISHCPSEIQFLLIARRMKRTTSASVVRVWGNVAAQEWECIERQSLVSNRRSRSSWFAAHPSEEPRENKKKSITLENRWSHTVPAGTNYWSKCDWLDWITT